MLTVEEMIYNPKKKSYTRCRCKCDCGNLVTKSSYNLRHNAVDLSCGCKKLQYERKSKTKETLGKKFGRLTVLKEIWNDDNGIHLLECKCDCGNIVTLRRNDVITMHTQSCGCLQKEKASKARETNDSGFISDFGVKILSPYKRNDKRQLLWDCECVCGKHFYKLPARIKNNHVRSCGCLNSSSNEKFIAKYLSENKIQFISQYTFDDCRSKNNYKLRFDFALLNDSGEVFYLIEYDGKQHYEMVPHFGGEQELNNTIERDLIKDNYCKKNHIPLLRLPYYLSNNEIINEITNTINP